MQAHLFLLSSPAPKHRRNDGNRKILAGQTSLPVQRKSKTPLDLRFRWKSRGFIGFGKDRLTKKETVFRLSLWCARRDLKVSDETQDKVHIVGKNRCEYGTHRPPADLFCAQTLRLFVGVKAISKILQSLESLSSFCGILHK